MNEKQHAHLDTSEDFGRSKKPVAAIIVAAVILVLLLLPCILAATSDTIYPRTSVAGIDVGGMTTAEAEAALSEALPGAYEDATLPITVDNGVLGGTTFELPLADIHITVDAAQAAETAWQNGRSGNFFTSGVAYARGLLLGHAVAPELKLDQISARAEIAAIAAQADTPVTECTWRIDGETLYVTKPKSGYLIDQQALLEAVEDAIGRYDFSGVVCQRQERSAASVTMEELYNDAHSEASNAYYDKATGTVKDGDTGVDFDPAEAQRLMDAAQAGTEFSIPVTITKPKITKEEMAACLFRDQLGTCTTTVTGSSNRKHNVTLAARACNGVVLNPGETFSYNATLGERTAANGYLPAGAYVGGKTVEEYGGGICQISSTLYLATLRSNLEIVSRTNHMFWPGYIPLGMDATVSWGGPDYQFKNNTDYPVKIIATYANGKATCTIYGTNLTGNSVKMEYVTLSTTPYETVEQEDPTLPAGTRKQEQNGYTGYKAATYRCLYDKDGNLISRTLEANSTYKARNQIILVGPSAENTVPATDPAAEPSTPPETETDPPEAPAGDPAPSESTDSQDAGDDGDTADDISA